MKNYLLIKSPMTQKETWINLFEQQQWTTKDSKSPMTQKETWINLFEQQQWTTTIPGIV